MMGSGKKGSGKVPGNYPGSVEDNVMMIHDFGDMNLDACDTGDWLMINNESGVRARNHRHNHPQVSANQAPKAWGQPGMLNQPPKSWGQGQPPMLGRPRTHDHVSWGNFYPTPTAGFVPRPPPPNFGGNSHNGMMGRNPVGLPPWSNGQNFNARGGGDGTRLNGGSKRPLVVDSDDDDEYDEEDEEVEESYSGSKAKNVTTSKTPTKGVHQGLTSDSRGHPGVGSKPNVNKDYGPSAASHPGVGYYGWRPAGGGMPPFPVPFAHFPPPPFPPPPSRPVENFAAADKKRSSEKTGENIAKKNSVHSRDGTKFDDDFDDEFDDEEDMISVEDEDYKNESDRVKHLLREHMKLNPRPGMPPPEFKHSWNVPNGGGSSQRQAYCNPSYINGKKSPISRDIADEIRQHNLAMESYRKKHLPPTFVREEKLPHNSNPISGATSYKTGAKNAGKDVEIPYESESTDFDDEEESEFDDDANDEVVARPELVNGKSEKSGKHMEVKFVKQISQIPKDAKKEVQSRKPQKEQCGESTDVYAGEQLQMKADKLAEQSNVHVSFFEDYKNRVKEVAKLVKFHITPKNELDTCSTDKELLMKIHEEKLEMKKRHQKEEQELEKQFTAALKRFMEKQTTVDADSDASSDL